MSCEWLSTPPPLDRGKPQLHVTNYGLAPGALLDVPVQSYDSLLVAIKGGDLLNEVKSRSDHLHVSAGQVMLLSGGESFRLRNAGTENTNLLLISVRPPETDSAGPEALPQKASALIAQCKSAEKNASENTRSGFYFCVGFLHGIVEESRFRRAAELDSGEAPAPTFCVPASASATDLATALVGYGKEHPERWDYPAGLVAHLALKTAFPCKR